MANSEKEVLKGLLLDRWMEDLAADRQPSILPEMNELSQQDIAETLALARWMTAAVNPVIPALSESEAVATKVRARIRRSDDHQQHELMNAMHQATSFSGLLLMARRIRQIRSSDLERQLRLPIDALTGLENGTVPPHRIAVDSMIALLRALRIATENVVELVRQSGREWAVRVYSQPATQLGRIDDQLQAEQRRALLAEDTESGEQSAQLRDELAHVEQYCQTLAARLH